MTKEGFAPILLIIPIAIVTVASVALISLRNSENLKPQMNSSPEPSVTPSPSSTSTPPPMPTPSPTPTATPTPSPSPSIAPQSKSTVTSGGNYTVLTFDLASTTVVTDTANDNDCSNDCPTKPLSQFIAENSARAGMNGTYFCPQDYSSCDSKVNSFDFPVWNNRQKKWINASTLFWNGRGMFVFRPGSAQFFSNSASVGAPSDITGGIVNYPSLLSGGQVVLDEGSLSDNLGVTKGTRSGMGMGDGKLFFVVARNANMSDMVSIFQSLGATDALNLDGGGSVALYDGGYKIGPGRNLPNAIIIK